MPLNIILMGSTMTWAKFNIGKIVVAQPAGYQRAVVLFSLNRQNLGGFLGGFPASLVTFAHLALVIPLNHAMR